MLLGFNFVLSLILTLMIAAAAAVLLTCTLRTDAHNALDYFSYLFSTYALIVGVSGLTRLFRLLWWR